MNDPMLLIPLFLWLFTYGIIAIFHRSVKRKAGVNSDIYANFRLPHFISTLLNSLASVGIILFVMNSTVSQQTATYFVVPYFGIIAYYTTSAFRALKEAKHF